MDWLRRLFLGDDRLFLGDWHLYRTIRAEYFHRIKLESEARRFALYLDYDRHGNKNSTLIQER